MSLELPPHKASRSRSGKPMTEVSPNTHLAALLQQHALLGGVVDYMVLQPPKPGVALDCQHRVAALSFIQAWNRTGDSPDDSSSYQPDKAVGRQITVRDFFGSRYDWSRRKLLVRCGTVGDDEGYAFAFGNPPYSMSGSEESIAELFDAINLELFGSDCDELEVFRWSNDWSDYFEAGLEWWGAFLWTVKPPSRPYIVAIGASTTD